MASPKTQQATGLRPPVDPNEFEHAPVRSTLTNDFAQASLGPQRPHYNNAKYNSNDNNVPYGYGRGNAGPSQGYQPGYMNSSNQPQHQQPNLQAELVNPQQEEEKGAADVSVCANCKGTSTTQWRRGNEGQVLCNACGIYERKNGTMRPLKLCDRRTFTRVKHKNGKKASSQTDDTKNNKGGTKPIKKKSDGGQSKGGRQQTARTGSGIEGGRSDNVNPDNGTKGQMYDRQVDTYNNVGPPERTIQRGASGELGDNYPAAGMQNSGYGCMSCPRPLTIADLNARRQQCQRCVSMGVYPPAPGQGPGGPPPYYGGGSNQRPPMGYNGVYNGNNNNGGSDGYPHSQPQPYRPSMDPTAQQQQQQRDPRYPDHGHNGYNPADNPNGPNYREGNPRSAPPPQVMSNIPQHMPMQGRAARTQSESLYPVAAKTRHPFATSHSHSSRNGDDQSHHPPPQVQGFVGHNRGDSEYAYGGPQDRQKFFGAQPGGQYTADGTYIQQQEGSMGEHGPAWGSNNQQQPSQRPGGVHNDDPNTAYLSDPNTIRHDGNDGERLNMQRTYSGPVQSYGGPGQEQAQMGNEGGEGDMVQPEGGYYPKQNGRKSGGNDQGSSAGGPTRRTTSSSHLRSPYGSNSGNNIVGSGTGKVVARHNHQLQAGSSYGSTDGSSGKGVQKTFDGSDHTVGSRNNSGDIGSASEREGESGKKSTPKIWGPYLEDSNTSKNNLKTSNSSPKSSRSYVGLHPNSPQDHATRSVSWQQQSTVRGGSSPLAGHPSQQQRMNTAEGFDERGGNMNMVDEEQGQAQQSSTGPRAHTPVAFHPWHTEETLQSSEPKQQYTGGNASGTRGFNANENHTQSTPAMASESMGEDDRGGNNSTRPNTATDPKSGGNKPAKSGRQHDILGLVAKRNASLSPHPHKGQVQQDSPEVTRVQRSYSDNYRVRSALEVARDVPSSGSGKSASRKFLVPPGIQGSGAGPANVAQVVEHVPKDVAGAHAMIDQHMSMGNYVAPRTAQEMDTKDTGFARGEPAGGVGPTRRLHTYSSPRLMNNGSSKNTSPKISPMYARVSESTSGDVYMADSKAQAGLMAGDEVNRIRAGSLGSMDKRNQQYQQASAPQALVHPQHAQTPGNGSNAPAKQTMSKLSTASGQRQCTMCGTTETAQWRSGVDKEILCNSCGLRQNHFQNREEKNERRRKRYWANQEAKKNKGAQNQGNANASRSEQTGPQAKQHKESLQEGRGQDADGDTVMKTNEVYT